MSLNQIPQNNAPSDPSLKDLLDLFGKNLQLNFNAHHVGTIQGFNAAKQTATATINYKKSFKELNPATQAYTQILIDYPLLTDCPVICLGGGPCALTFPIQQGDECLVLFNDRDIDNWFSGITGAGVATPRLHSFSDGIILVGLRSVGNVLTAYDLVRAVLRNGTTLVGVGPSKVKIANAGNGSLGVAMAGLLTALSTFMTACAGSTSDTTLANAATAFSAAAVTYITNIEGILE